MNITRLSLPLAGLLVSAAAVAVEGTQDFDTPAPSTRTRAEVKAELAEARAAGQLASPGEAYGGFRGAQVASTRSRDEVRAELAAARAAGELNQRGRTDGSFGDTGFRSE